MMNDLCVMSFNIRFANPRDGDDRWEFRREMALDLLREKKPDVLSLQEALRSQLDDFQEALPDYGQIAVGRSDGQSEGEHCALLYRRSRFEASDTGTFWFSDTPEVPGSKHWGNNCVRICTWARLFEKPSGSAFYAFNVHLDHESLPSQEKSIRLLAQRIQRREHPDPVIVTGDFNVGEGHPVAQYLTADATPALLDTYRAIHPDETMVGTYNGFKGHRDGDKIDYIFVSRDFEVANSEIIRDNRKGRYPSDHFPILSQIRLKAAR